jgi:pSer/pThr/pTyr-binding forkhead associated (FHA) protein
VASLECLAGNDVGTTYPVESGVTLGREKGAGLFLRDKGASRKHVQFEKDANGWHVVDLKSANGTKVNGNKITRHALVPGDVIEIGDSKLKWIHDQTAGAKPAATPAAGIIKKKAPPPRRNPTDAPIVPSPSPDGPRARPVAAKIKLSGLDDAIAKADAAGMGEAAKKRVDPNAAFAPTEAASNDKRDINWDKRGVMTTAMTTSNTANPLKFSFSQLSTGTQAIIALVFLAVAYFIVTGIYGVLGPAEPTPRRPAPVPTASSNP